MAALSQLDNVPTWRGAAESVLGDDAEEVDVESPGARRLIGQRCKLLLDVGRAYGLSRRYASVRVVRYTAMSIEDRLIIAA